MGQIPWRKVLPFALCLALTALGMGLGLQLREPQNYWDGSILGQHELLLTIGTRAHAAGTPDYVCDGTDDNVEFQTALNALPAGGGKLVVLGGTYNFSATVTRLIDDVTIEGMGQATYFVYNGADPIFTSGGNNWTYRDFRTDAGGVNLNSTTGYVLENLLLGATAYGVTSEAGGGVFTSVSGNMNASNITAGTIDPARLGSGTANSTNVLYGDSTWGAVSASGNATWGSITGNMTTQADLTAALNGKVNTSTTVNGQALSGNVTISSAPLMVASANGTAQEKAAALASGGGVCDGTDDDVEVQAALDALPATGGWLILLGGTYNFSATVSRAINNVTIEGSGKSTYFANDGGTALFSAGAQTGWLFQGFRTDAGYLTLYGDTEVDGVWNVNTLVAVGVDSTRTVNLYVAGNGSDSNNGLSTATAKLTVQAAADLVPGNYGYNYVINIASGTYAGTVTLVGRKPVGNVSLRFLGYQNTAANQFSHTQSVAGTSSGAGGGGNFPTAKPYLLDASENFTAYKGGAYFLHITGGTGYNASADAHNWYAIGDSTLDAGSTHLPIVGTWTVATTDNTTTYEIIPADKCTIGGGSITNSSGFQFWNVALSGLLNIYSAPGFGSILWSLPQTNLFVAVEQTNTARMLSLSGHSEVVMEAVRIIGGGVGTTTISTDLGENALGIRSYYSDNTQYGLYLGPTYANLVDIYITGASIAGMYVERAWIDNSRQWLLSGNDYGIQARANGTKVGMAADVIIQNSTNDGINNGSGAQIEGLVNTVKSINNTGWGINTYGNATSYGSVMTTTGNAAGAHTESSSGVYY